MSTIQQRIRIVLGAARRRARFAVLSLASPWLEPRRRQLNHQWRTAVLAAAEPVETAPARSLLVLAPHPDDESIGCAAVIAQRVAAGHRVDIVVTSDGGDSHRSAQVSATELAALRREESIVAAGILGVPAEQVHFLGADADELRARPDSIVGRLCRVLESVAPQEVLVISADEWPDEHRLVHDLGLAALTRTGFTGPVSEYPVWQWTDGPMRTAPFAPLPTQLRELRRARREPVAPGWWSVPVDRELKQQAFAAYRTQTTNYTGEPSWVPFPDGWLEPFLDREVFRPVTVPIGRDAAR